MDASINLAAALACTLAKAIAASAHRIDVTCSLYVLVEALTLPAP